MALDFNKLDNYVEESEDEVVEATDGIVSGSGVIETGFFLKREAYNTAKGERFYMYYTDYQMAGKTRKISFTAGKKDKGVYETLGQVWGFYAGKAIPIYIEETSFTNNDGKKQSVTKTFVIYQPMQGMPIELGWRVNLKPKADSDTGAWTYFVNMLKYQESEKKKLESAPEATPAEETPKKTGGKGKTGAGSEE